MHPIVLTNEDHQLAVDYVYTNPIGSIICYAGSTAPDGWLFCDGSSLSKTVYADLYSVIGTTYGESGDHTSFYLPNLSQRLPLGKSVGSSLGGTGGNQTITLSTNQLPAHTHTGTTNADGTHTHTGTTSTDGSHSHSINDPGHSHTQTTINDDFNNSGTNPPGFSADSAGIRTWDNISTNTTGITINSNGNHSHTLNIDNAGSHTHTFTTNSTGSGESVNVMNPYLVLNYLIRY